LAPSNLTLIQGVGFAEASSVSWLRAARVIFVVVRRQTPR
jgi:hypothetical protein